VPAPDRDAENSDRKDGHWGKRKACARSVTFRLRVPELTCIACIQLNE
jgi:hypothetical protein